MQFLETILLLGVLVTPRVSALIYQDAELEASRFGIRQHCGNNSWLGTKILGGREVIPGEFPYTVALLKPNGEGELRLFCGGSLISDQWVLTAAHCVRGFSNARVNSTKSISSIVVYTGAHNVSKSGEPSRQTSGVKKAYYHSFDTPTLANDIGLIQLDKPVVFGQYVQPICLSNADPVPREDAVLSGWGTLVEDGPTSDVLQTISVPLIGNNECQEGYSEGPPVPPIRDTMVCTGVTNPKKDACQGDSGGPLVSFNGKAVQVGIVSWGAGCGDYPGVYTRVNRYLDWIDRVMRRAD